MVWFPIAMLAGAYMLYSQQSLRTGIEWDIQLQRFDDRRQETLRRREEQFPGFERIPLVEAVSGLASGRGWPEVTDQQQQQQPEDA